MGNYSVLRYPGGKTRAIKELIKYIPEDVKNIVSPFYGGGSFENYLASIGYNVEAYDLFGPLVCFWQAMKNNRTDLISMVRSYYPISKDQFYALQKEILIENNPVLVGAMFYVLNRSSFSGTALSGGMSPGHARFTLKQINELSSFNLNVNIELGSFENTILRSEGFIYADPPYMIKSNLYGDKGSAHKGFNHALLAEVLKEKGNFLLSYNNCDKVKDLYKGYRFIYPKWSYGMSKNKESKEMLIIGDRK